MGHGRGEGDVARKGMGSGLIGREEGGVLHREKEREAGGVEGRGEDD